MYRIGAIYNRKVQLRGNELLLKSEKLDYARDLVPDALPLSEHWREH